MAFRAANSCSQLQLLFVLSGKCWMLNGPQLPAIVAPRSRGNSFNVTNTITGKINEIFFFIFREKVSAKSFTVRPPPVRAL